jgi:Oxaloacetate decarboxylase, gamma chain.
MFNVLIPALAANKTAMLQSLEIMWKGMLAIFIAIGLVFLAIYLMNLICKYVKNMRAQKAAQKTAEENPPTNP